MRKDSISLVVFGATGDLMARKILPALFFLYKKNKLPENFRLIGVSRRELSEESFRAHAREALSRFDAIKKDKKLESFLKLFSFVRGFFDEPYTYEDLKRMIGPHSKTFFYLSVTPQFFAPILKNLDKSGAISPRSHIFVEKPIGLNLKSARSIEKLLARYFDRQQIYRVDHYLAKDGLQDLFNFRFKKKSLESVWSGKYISKMEIRLWEHKDVGYRGEFYDGVGALRDVGQNHLLEMLALLIMNKPKSMNGIDIQKERAQALECLKKENLKDIQRLSFRAQYHGYRGHKGVSNTSKTETFFRITAYLWKGSFQSVPIIIEAGKAMPENRKEMVIYFKDGKRLVFPVEEHKVVYQYVEEYMKIFEGAFKGDASMFAGSEEVLASWRFIDPIIDAFRKNKVKLNYYNPHIYPKIGKKYEPR